MTLTDLYYQANGTAFHHEITDEIALDYLSEQFKILVDKGEYSDDLEGQNSQYEDENSELQGTVTDLEEERDQLQDELTELKEGLKLLGMGRGSRLASLLEHIKENNPEHLAYCLSKGDYEGILEALEVLA